MPRTGRPPAMSTEERKEAIYAAAEKLLGEQAYEKVSMSAIGNEAGMSKKTLYQYFKSKEELLRELISSSYIWPEDAFETASRENQFELLRACLRVIANHVLSDRHITLCRLAINESIHTESLSNAFLKMGIGRGREAVIQILGNIPADQLRLDLPPEILSSMLYGSTSGPQLMNALLTGQKPNLDRAYKTIDQVLDKFFIL